MPMVTLLIKSEFKGGNDLSTLFGLVGELVQLLHSLSTLEETYLGD